METHRRRSWCSLMPLATMMVGMLYLCLLAGQSALVDAQGVRLAGGSTPSDGRLEVEHNKTWKPVCMTSRFTKKMESAKVVCRQLGFPPPSSEPSTILIPSPLFPKEVGVHLSNPQCSGYEWNLFQCFLATPLGPKGHRCDRFSSVAINCTGNATTLRLVGGPSPNIGRLEVDDGTSKQHVCGAFFYKTQANVACRQMGFKRALRVLQPNTYGWVSGDPKYYRLLCNGAEKTLGQCREHLVFAEQFCVNNTATIECTNTDSNHNTGGGGQHHKSWSSQPASVGVIVIMVLALCALAAGIVAFVIFRHRGKGDKTRAARFDSIRLSPNPSEAWK